MTELFAENLNIINQRWPDIASSLQEVSFDHLNATFVTSQNQTISVNGIQLCSRHDRPRSKPLLSNAPKTADKSLYTVLS
ncbi:hypothetical protein K0I73_12680 [Shewanella mesophila]|uniref:hypothetical protein n=1 Tax=Shewanella mesophila TaxID=2864208 RepID=UPI001C65B606|nr:hypothetical protein [Shewanella mesophila]QYJ85077.1 hypothetical protein K0I73_12680 [Shewanella mesophila]